MILKEHPCENFWVGNLKKPELQVSKWIPEATPFKNLLGRYFEVASGFLLT
jgi:hypothetical protein